MRSPPSSIERFLVLVLVGFIILDLLLVVPAFASELRLDLIHPSLPVVRLDSLRFANFQFLGEAAQDSQPDFTRLAIQSESLDSAWPAPTPMPSLSPNVYKVQAGDTLGRIARAHGTTVNAIAAASRVSNPDLIFVGQELVIPPSSTPKPIDQEQVPTPLWSPTPSPTFAGIQLPTQVPSATLGAEATPSQAPTFAPLPTEMPSLTPAPSSTPTPTVMATSTQIPSYTPTSSEVPTEQSPTLTPSQVAVATATVICTALPTTACESTPDPSSTPTAIPTSLPSPTHTQTAIPAPTSSVPVPAFPGAQGWGAGSIGGRGGRVIEVTNLNDSGPGSLRAAAKASDPRIVVFRVSGVIRLEGPIDITYPFITIAGQTAPGGGITLVGNRLTVSTDNVIIRYLRWRGEGRSFLAIRPWDNAHDIIVDHCSATWGEDDIVDIWFDPGNDGKLDLHNITVQNCLIAEPLAVQPTGMLIGAEWSESVDYLERIHNISIHHNLFGHVNYRSPRIKARYTEVINNVVYNWGDRIGGSARASEVDWIGNYFKAGPMTNTGSNAYLRHESVDYYNWDIVYPSASLYVVGNVSPERGYAEPALDNWWMNTEYGGPNAGEAIAETHRRYSPQNPAPFPVTIQPVYDAYENVSSDVGANARLDALGNWVTNSDAVDQRILSDVQNGTGPASHAEINEPGAIGPVDPGTPYDDSDQDGMADQWELLYCFSPNDPTDSPGDADGDGYTNVEEFLNGTQPTVGGQC